MKSKLIEKLRASKEYRDAFVASQMSMGLPFQIRALRKQRKWDQKKLATEADMLQPRISTMESPGYASPNLETLKRLASAFDVALIVRFVPFSELLRWSDRFSPDEFQVPSFDNDLGDTAQSSENVRAITGTWRHTTADEPTVPAAVVYQFRPRIASANTQVATGHTGGATTFSGYETARM